MPPEPLILGGSQAQKQERINISKGGISVERGGRYDMLYEETLSTRTWRLWGPGMVVVGDSLYEGSSPARHQPFCSPSPAALYFDTGVMCCQCYNKGFPG